VPEQDAGLLRDTYLNQGDIRSLKRKGAGSPTPDAYGHSHGLPQSFTRSQKERPLGEKRVPSEAPGLVAALLRDEDDSEIPPAGRSPWIACPFRHHTRAFSKGEHGFGGHDK
jgi:hypothetical protein